MSPDFGTHLVYRTLNKNTMAKKEGIRTLFDNIATDYDKLNHILSMNIDKGWRKKAVREIVDTNEQLEILDVACGTGDFTIEIAQKAAVGSKVIGIDLSEGMMEIGRRKIQAAGVDAIMVQGDCEQLPYKENTFHRISVGFGVRNFEHIEIGLKEMFRVLRNNGKLVIVELSIPTNSFIRWCYKLYFLKILPTIGGWVSGNRGAYEYLPGSVLRFPAPDKFIGMMQDAGFKNVRHKSFTFGICRMYIGIKTK